MKTFFLDLKKYGLEHLENAELSTIKDDDIINMANAFSDAIISPNVPEIMFDLDNVKQLLSLSKCSKCGKCCLPAKGNPDNPGVMVGEFDLINISKNTKHSLKSLHKVAKINKNPVYTTGVSYLPLPCMFFNKSERSCKIYSHRPFICQIYPISDDPEGKSVTIDVQCKYGKEIYIKTLKYLRELDRKGK